ncbi:hypothetical protein [Pseudogemmobacter bohemicus]|uniref:hypothetical protein n=1 Tax=Pseudogemmobacter bohemicus TaxID=2250708 RepID=UPI0013003309|nr:hypothetical protein [Pseudogemmobacter bohemicus]
MHGFFKDAPKWKLINNFTIERDESLSDRPFMATSVPQRILINITSLTAVSSAAWKPRSAEYDSTKNDSLTEPDKNNGCHRSSNYIYGSGKLDDDIVLFSMTKGEEARFSKIDHIRISPIPPGTIGGDKSSTVMDGISYSGMSSKKLPDDGLMAGEPGVLFVHDGLQLEVHLEEGAFNKLFEEIISSNREIEKSVIEFVAELFQDEVEASLSENWHRHEYGILNHNPYSSSTRARLETISIAFRAVHHAATDEVSLSAREHQSDTPHSPLLTDQNINIINRKLALLVGIASTIAALIAIHTVFSIL